MSGFGQNPVTTTQGALSTNQFPVPSVAVPGTANGDLTALEGGPISTDSNTNKTAPASMYVKDGNDLTQGATTDVAVVGDNAGSISAKLRGLSKIFNDVWDSVNHLLGVKATQNGTWTVQPGNTANTTAWKVDASSTVLTANVAGTVAVSNFPGTQPVSGTVAATQSGTWTMQPGNTPNTVAWKMDGSAVTQPVSGTFWQATQPVSGTFWQTTQPISGTVTANVDATNSTHLANIDTHTPTQGQTTMASSSPVVISSDQTPLVTSTATRTNVTAAVADTSLLASNTSRKGAIFYNDSTAILYLAYGGTTASTTSYSVQIPAQGYFELPPQPVFTGAIRGIWSAANGAVRITELS